VNNELLVFEENAQRSIVRNDDNDNGGRNGKDMV